MNAVVKPLCIYHHNCADGFSAAWTVKQYFGDVDFHHGKYTEAPPDVTGRDVIIVDFSYSYDAIIEMSWTAASILILDHHKSAAENLIALPSAGLNISEFKKECEFTKSVPNMLSIGVLFDMERSGAGIAWDFFFPNLPRPALINHIEDRDLWRFALPNTREIQANIFSHPYDFDVWDKLMTADCSELAIEGKAIERKHFKDMHELIAVTAREMVIGGLVVPVANLPYTMSSDAGSLMAVNKPFAACYWDTPAGRTFSLRSVEGGEDVSLIAQLYGGGGHKHAAGFSVDRETALQMELEESKHESN